jgi:hypothetical protein
MRTTGKLILGLAVAALFGAAATPALATPTWQVCTNLEAKIGSYEDAKCSKEKEEGGFEWLEVTGTEKVVGKGTVALGAKAPIIGIVEVKCSVADEGVVGPANLDKVTKVTFEKCTAGTNCEKLEGNAEPRNLPWKTELFETEKTIHDKTTSGGSGEPGWKATCKVLGKNETNECTSEHTTALLENMSGDVNTVFESKSGKSNCTTTGKETGEIKGTVKMEGSEGKGIRVAPQPEFRAPGNEGKKIKFTIEQALHKNIKFTLEHEVGKIDGEIWCPNGVDFLEQELTVPAKAVKLEPLFPAPPTCEAKFGTIKAEEVKVECPLLEIFAINTLEFVKTCNYKIKLQGKMCVVEVSSGQKKDVIAYSDQGSPRDILADILLLPLKYRTETCSLPSGEMGTLEAALILKGFIETNNKREPISIEVK